MQSETTNTSERRRIVAGAACSSPARSVDAPGAAGVGGRLPSSWARRSTWVRPGARQHHARPAVEQQRADAVAAAGQEAGERDRQLGEHDVLAAPRGTEDHRPRPVEQQPGGELAVLGVLADVRLVEPGGDVPVDVADVVLGRVRAQVGEVDAGP